MLLLDLLLETLIIRLADPLLKLFILFAHVFVVV